MLLNEFFAYAQKRQAILLRRRAGLPRSQWTEDPILQTYRFCNVFREDDLTTIWFRENVRERVDPEDLLLATVLFRWFNRITTGEAIFKQTGIQAQDGSTTMVATAWDCHRGSKAKNWMNVLYNAIRSYCGDGPYVTGSYIIKTPDGMKKLDGVLDCLEQFMLGGGKRKSTLGYQEINDYLVRQLADPAGVTPITMEQLWGWLKEFPYLGDFMAYEIVTDLDQTFQFPDRMTWANPGPGATRGLGRVFHEDHAAFRPSQKQHLNFLMQQVLKASKEVSNWPNQDEHGMGTDTIPLSGVALWGWPKWNMRTVEHTLCEFDKYERTRLGQGKPRGVYR